MKGEGEVEESRHEGCRDFILSVRKVSYRFLSAEIVNLKWGSRVRIMLCINKCRLILFI